MQHIIKRHGRKEPYDERKVYASVYSAAINCHYKEHDAEHLALGIMRKVNQWADKHEHIDSAHIRDFVSTLLTDDEVVMMYQSHLDVC